MQSHFAFGTASSIGSSSGNWLQPPTVTSSLLASTVSPVPTTLLGSNQASAGAVASSGAQTMSLTQLAEFQQLKEAFNTQGPYCRFRQVFYNASSMAASINQQVPQGMDPNIWEQIQKNNPDSSRLIPVQLSGFDELFNRVQHQSQRIQEHIQALDGIERMLSECSDIEKTDCTIKLTDFRTRYYMLFRRLVQFIGRVWCLLSRGRPLRTEELQMKENITVCERRITSPGQLRDKLADLMELFRSSISIYKLNEPNYHASFPKESMERIHRVVSKQQEGLDRLLQVSIQLEKDLSVVADGLMSLSYSA
eukprot:jgi/Galph1/3192/GphlegSOOS_G1830.1